MGVIFSFMGSLSLDRYHSHFLMIFKESLIFLSLSNPVLQYIFYADFVKVSVWVSHNRVGINMWPSRSGNKMLSLT